MFGISTQASSLILQRNFSQSTNSLNRALERLSTGYEINSASDNAANYSYVNLLSTKLSSWDIATDNVAKGINMSM